MSYSQFFFKISIFGSRIHNNVHPKTLCNFGNIYTYFSQTNYSQRLAIQVNSAEIAMIEIKNLGLIN